MFEAQYLFKGNATYGPWAERRADNVIIIADVLTVSGGTVVVSIFHKNKEDTGDGASAGSLTASSTGRADVEIAGLKELVRYKFECTGASATDFVLFRMLSRVWFDTVAA